MVGQTEETRKNMTDIEFLVLGESLNLTDTIMIGKYDPNSQKASLISIQRDTFIGDNPKRATAYDKINSVYQGKNSEKILKEVNELTGLNLKYYVAIDTKGLRELVDAIGGVEFYVPMDMKYDDTSQDLHINLKEGLQKLNGDQAEQVLRFRHNNDGTSYPEEYGDNDTGRMRTQREFIMQVIKQTAKPENIFKIGEILEVAKEYVITNIDFEVAKDYVPYAVEFNTDDLLTASLPGINTNKNTSGTWVFTHDKKATQALIQELFYDRDNTEELTENAETTTNNVTSNTSTNSTINNTVTSNKKSDIKIEILNGSGDSKKLQKAVSELEGAGYKVTRTGTTNSTSKTTIIDKKDVSNTLLQNMKEVLGTGVIQNSQSSSSKVDVTIIIGKDY